MRCCATSKRASRPMAATACSARSWCRRRRWRGDSVAAEQRSASRRHPSDQPAQDLRGLPAQARVVDIEGAGAFLLALALMESRAAMAAGPRRSNPRAAVTVAIAGKVDDVI